MSEKRKGNMFVTLHDNAKTVAKDIIRVSVSVPLLLVS